MHLYLINQWLSHWWIPHALLVIQNLLENLMEKVKLNRSRLLLVLIFGFVVSIPNSWANEISPAHSAASTIITDNSRASESDDSDSSSDDEASKPPVMVAGQYSDDDDLESFGKPSVIEC